MAAGITQLRQVQLGPELTSGSAVTTTALWRGESGGIVDESNIMPIPEHIGILNGGNRSIFTKYLGSLTLDDTVATFQQLQYLLTGLGGSLTGAQDGSGSDYIYTTTLPTSSLPTIQTFTAKSGNNKEVFRMAYAHVAEFTIKGAMGEAVMMGGKLFGRRRSASTFASITPVTVTEIVTSNGQFFYDAIGGTYGSTQVSNQILGFELNFKINLVPKWTMDNSLDFTRLEYTGHEATGRIRYEHDTAVTLASGVQADYDARITKKGQLKFTGPAVTTPGTTYSNYTFIYNFPLKWTKVGVLESVDGNDTITADFESKYSVTGTTGGAFILVNESATIP